MTVRNFWVDCDIDGRATVLSGGPKAKDGGMTVDILVRNTSRIHRACSIRCYPDNSKLCMHFKFDDGTLINKEFER
jgi:hypothetical protein